MKSPQSKGKDEEQDIYPLCPDELCNLHAWHRTALQRLGNINTNSHFPQHAPTYPYSHSWPVFFGQETRCQGIYFNLTHHRTSLHRIHGLYLNTVTDRLFTSSQQWDLIRRGKLGHWGVSSRTKDLEGRSNGDAQITKCVSVPSPTPPNLSPK